MENARVVDTKCCPVSSAVRVVIRELLWVVAAAAALAVAALPLDHVDSFCGIWGCYPPLQSLAALHLLWLVLFLRVLVEVTQTFPRRLRLFGGCVFVTAAAVAGGVCFRDVTIWFDHVPDEDAKHWPRRVVYTLLNRWEWPLLPAMLTGLIAIAVGSFVRRPAAVELIEPSNQDVDSPA